MLEDFIIADLTETDDAQITLGRSFFATSSCTIDVKGRWIIFVVGGVMLHFVLWTRKLFPLILSYLIYFRFLLKLRWMMIGVILALLILIGFRLRIPTRVI